MILHKQILLGITLSIMFGCATSTGKLSWNSTESVAYSTETSPGKASVIFYRTADAIDGTAVNVYVNREYVSSLSAGAYVQEDICPTIQTLYAAFTGMDTAYQGKLTAGGTYDFPQNTLTYIRVVSLEGYPALQLASQAEAEEELSGLVKQTHTLSRANEARDCESVTAASLTAE